MALMGWRRKLLPCNVKRLRSRKIKSLYVWTLMLSGFALLLLLLQTEEASGSDSFARHFLALRFLQWQRDGVPGTTSPTPSPVLQADCNALLQGDAEEIAITKEMLYAETRSIKGAEFYINATKDCSNYRRTLRFVNTPISRLEKSFPLAYIVTVHKNMQQLEQLLESVYMPQNIYCIHVDGNSQPAFRKAVESVAMCFPNVFIASQLEHVVYAGFTRLKADLNCMRDLLDRSSDWKYVINMAGQEYPLKTNREMVQYLGSLNGGNDIPGVIPTSDLHRNRFLYVHTVSNSSKMERTKTSKSPPPNNITIYIGTAYYFVTRKFAQHVLTSPLAKELLEWLQDAHSPDEFYWATLQRLPGSPGGTSVVGWGSRVRAIKWSYFAEKQYPGCQGQYQRNICVYGVGDLNWLIQRPHMFANKFDINMDHIVLRCLTAWLRDKVKRQNTD